MRGAISKFGHVSVAHRQKWRCIVVRTVQDGGYFVRRARERREDQIKVGDVSIGEEVDARSARLTLLFLP